MLGKCHSTEVYSVDCKLPSPLSAEAEIPLTELMLQTWISIPSCACVKRWWGLSASLPQIVMDSSTFLNVLKQVSLSPTEKTNPELVRGWINTQWNMFLKEMLERVGAPLLRGHTLVCHSPFSSMDYRNGHADVTGKLCLMLLSLFF